MNERHLSLCLSTLDCELFEVKTLLGSSLNPRFGQSCAPIYAFLEWKAIIQRSCGQHWAQINSKNVKFFGCWNSCPFLLFSNSSLAALGSALALCSSLGRGSIPPPPPPPQCPSLPGSLWTLWANHPLQPLCFFLMQNLYLHQEWPKAKPNDLSQKTFLTHLCFRHDNHSLQFWTYLLWFLWYFSLIVVYM